jgi:hypothetical protein
MLTVRLGTLSMELPDDGVAETWEAVTKDISAYLRKEPQNGLKCRALLESLRLGTKGDACADDANVVPVCSHHPKLFVLAMLRLNP